MPRYDVYLEISKTGAVVAHVPDLLGCHLFADNSATAMARLGERVAGYIEWRRSIRIAVPSLGGRRQLSVVEEALTDALTGAPGARAFFAWDAQPLTKSQRAEALRILNASRSALLTLVEGIHPRVMRWAPAPKSRSVQRNLTHLERRERWYLSRLGITIPPPKGTSVRDQLDHTRDTVVDALNNLDETTLGVVFEPRRGAANNIEKWSARKVVRRLVEHELEHIDVIRDIIRRYSESSRIN